MPRLLFVFFLVGAVLSASSQAQSTLNSNDDLVQLLKSAAQICSGNCQTTCLDGAKVLEQNRVVSGHEDDIKKRLTACSTGLFMDSAARSHPDKSKFTSQLMMAQIQLGNIAASERTSAQQTMASTAISSIEIDTNVLSDGQLDMDKVLAIYEKLPLYCQAGLPGSPQNLAAQCSSQCERDLQEMRDSVAKAMEIAPTIDSLTGMEKMQAISSLSSYTGSIRLKLANTSGCKIYMQPGMYKGPELAFKGSFQQAADVIAKGEWPPKKAMSLDIDNLLAEAAPSTADVLASIKAVDAVNTLSFAEAQQQLVATKEFKTLASEVNKSGYSVKQIRTAIAKLEANRDKIDKAQFEQKHEEFANLLSKAELVGAATEACNLQYLQTYNQDRIWRNPALTPSLRPDPQASELQYQIESPYLHRLCANQLHDQLVSQLNAETRADSFNQAAQQVLSKPILSGRATCRDCPPARVMTEAQWLPKWHAYAAARGEEFAAAAGSRQYAENLARVVKETGLLTYLQSDPASVNNALAVYKAMSRSADYQLKAAAKNGDYLVVSRATSSTLHGWYEQPKIGHEKPKAYAIPVTAYIGCSLFADNLQRFLGQPAAISEDDLQRMQAGFGACLQTQPVFQRNGNVGMSRDLAKAVEDYTVALTLDNDKGQALQQQIRERADQNIKNLLTVSKVETGLFGFNFEQLYAAQRFNDAFYKLLQPGSTQDVFAPEVSRYYEAATGLQLADFDAAKKRKAALELKQRQDTLLAANGIPSETPAPPAADAVVNQDAAMQKYFNKCATGFFGRVNCNCIAQGYGQELKAGTFKSDYDLGQKYTEQCLDRPAVRADEYKRCDLTNRYRNNMDCDCVADRVAQSTDGQQRTTDKLRQEAMAACRR